MNEHQTVSFRVLLSAALLALASCCGSERRGFADLPLLAETVLQPISGRGSERLAIWTPDGAKWYRSTTTDGIYLMRRALMGSAGISFEVTHYDPTGKLIRSGTVNAEEGLHPVTVVEWVRSSSDHPREAYEIGIGFWARRQPLEVGERDMLPKNVYLTFSVPPWGSSPEEIEAAIIIEPVVWEGDILDTGKRKARIGGDDGGIARSLDGAFPFGKPE